MVKAFGRDWPVGSQQEFAVRMLLDARHHLLNSWEPPGESESDLVAALAVIYDAVDRVLLEQVS